MGHIDRIEHITVFSPVGSKIPDNYVSKVEISPSWEYDDISSLIRTLKMILEMSPQFDLIFFNLILTSFGKKSTSNAIGLLLPVAVRLLSGKKVVVYMHNLIETQDLEKLGYGQKRVSKHIASFIEALLLKTVDVIVPLSSQKAKVKESFGIDVSNTVFPGLEGIWALQNSRIIRNNSPLWKLSGTRVLLFGSWGPQKDIIRILKILDELNGRYLHFNVTVAGSINGNFPEYEEIMMRRFGELNQDRFRYIKNPPEADIPALFIDSDILILPYKAAGGYSAVMNVAKLYCLKIVSYDVEDLKLFSREINLDVEFIVEGDKAALARSIETFAWQPIISSTLQYSVDKNVLELTNLLGV